MPKPIATTPKAEWTFTPATDKKVPMHTWGNYRIARHPWGFIVSHRVNGCHTSLGTVEFLQWAKNAALKHSVKTTPAKRARNPRED